MKIYDLIIIGAGPAGMTAAIYAKNFGLDYLIIGQEEGGLVNRAYKIENYPGIFSVSGKELVDRFKAHQKYLKAFFKKERVEKIRQGKVFKIRSNKGEYQAKAIILALGTESKKLDIKNVEKFEGRDVKNKIVAVIGGANAAAMSAVALSKVARKVYLIYRRSKLRANAIWISRIEKSKKIEVIYRTNVVCVEGKKKLEKIILDKKYKNKNELLVDELFIETGTLPSTFLIKDLGVEIDKNGYIKVGNKQVTNVSGVFAAGDITTGSSGFRQIITACAEGAIAALGALNYLKKK